MALHIDPELGALAPPLSLEERVQLEENLICEGCRDALVVWKGQDILLDGHNRYQICRQKGLEFKTIELELANRDEAKAWIIRNQFGRRNLTLYQRAELALLLEPLIAKKARENQRRAGGAVPQKSAEPIETRKEVARLAQTSHDTIAKVKTIRKKADEELQRKLRCGQVSINEAYHKIRWQEKKKQRQALAEKIRSRPPRAPRGPFEVIVIDPPWPYDNLGRTCSPPYPTMPMEDIHALPIPKLADEDCIVWLWTPNSFMSQAFSCLQVWQLDPKTILTWDKQRKGRGDWLFNVTEHCILAARGKPLVTLTDQTTLIREPRREHSRKPEAFYRLVESLCPGSKLEMFARQRRDGWQSYGAEVERFATGQNQ